MPQTSISLDPDVLEFVKETARRECRSVSGQIEYWITQHKLTNEVPELELEAHADEVAVRA